MTSQIRAEHPITLYLVKKNGKILQFQHKDGYYPLTYSIYSLCTGSPQSIIALAEGIYSKSYPFLQTILLTKPEPHLAKVAIYREKDLHEDEVLVALKPVKVFKELDVEAILNIQRFESIFDNFVQGFSIHVGNDLVPIALNDRFCKLSCEAFASSFFIGNINECEAILFLPHNTSELSIMPTSKLDVNGKSLFIHYESTQPSYFPQWAELIFAIALSIGTYAGGSEKVDLSWVLDQIKIGVIWADPSGNLEFINETARKQLIYIGMNERYSLSAFLSEFGYMSPYMPTINVRFQKIIREDPFRALELHVAPLLTKQLFPLGYILLMFEVDSSSSGSSETIFDSILYQILNNTQTGVLLLDFERGKAYPSRPLRSLFGLNKSEYSLSLAYPHNFEIIEMHEEPIMEMILQIVQNKIRNPSIQHVPIHQKDNGEKDLIIIPKIINDEKGNPIGAYALVSQQSQNGLSEQQQEVLDFWSHILNLLPNAIGLLRQDGSLLLGNDKFKTLKDHLLPPNSSLAIDLIQETLDHAFTSEKREVTFNNGVYFAQMTNLGNDIFLLSLTDLEREESLHQTLIQTSKILESKNKELQQQIRRLEETNNDALLFLRAASHDLKSPLRSLATFSTFIAEGISTSPIVQDIANQINELSHAIVEALEEVVYVSRVFLHSSSNEQIDAIKILESVAQSPQLKPLFLYVDSNGKTRWVDNPERVREILRLVLMTNIYDTTTQWDLHIHGVHDVLRIFLHKAKPLFPEQTVISPLKQVTMTSLAPSIYFLANYVVHSLSEENSITIYIRQLSKE